MIAIFGGVTRKGRWRVRKNTHALALFGGMDLDLRDAIFEAPVVEISGFLVLRRPRHQGAGRLSEMTDQTAGIFGGTDVRDVGDPSPGAPTLVIKGSACFGGVSIKGPRNAADLSRWSDKAIAQRQLQSTRGRKN